MDEADVVVAGISGSAGLLPVYRAVERGKTVALANKETLVMAGHLILRLAEKNGSAILPVDSEHSALHQCLRGSKPTELKRLWLTASGGPFLNHTSAQMKSVSVEEALSHPTWDMGPKISVDSATMMNKGLEVIEAHHLFGVPGDQISVVVHPQSIVHSMVEFVDGNILAQMSITDMRSAILYALSYPDRWQSNLPKLDLFETSSLEFHAPDLERFPCVSLAYEALRNGETYPIALNSANEVAVDAFLKGNLPFRFIPKVIEEILVGHVPVSAADVETVMEVDRQSREESERLVLSLIGASKGF
jgi:1-deoxy-D-xylulose-5-phosphate reductoisomerase